MNGPDVTGQRETIVGAEAGGSVPPRLLTTRTLGDRPMAKPESNTDKRAAILRWIEEQERWEFVAGTPTGLPLALAALRVEVERHEQMPEWRNEEDKALGFELGCFCQGDERPSWPCSAISRIFASLGLRESE